MGKDLIQANPIRLRHFIRIWDEACTLPRPDHDGRDQVARARHIVIEQPQHGIVGQWQAHLFVQLAQGRLNGGFAFVESTSR